MNKLSIFSSLVHNSSLGLMNITRTMYITIPIIIHFLNVNFFGRNHRSNKSLVTTIEIYQTIVSNFTNVIIKFFKLGLCNMSAFFRLSIVCIIKYKPSTLSKYPINCHIRYYFFHRLFFEFSFDFCFPPSATSFAIKLLRKSLPLLSSFCLRRR